MNLTYDIMKIEDYIEIYDLWRSIPGIGLNEADERKNIRAYLLRNPEQSFVCKAGERIIGTIMCGNDGRRAFLYHLAVSPEYRRNGIATELVNLAIHKQKKFGINKCVLFILNENTLGKSFWASMGFTVHPIAGTMVKSIE